MEPTSVHQPRSVCTAKAAVSSSTPTPTKALVGGEVVDAVRNSAPQLLDQEIVDAHILEIPLGPPFAPRVLEIPDQLLFFVSTEMTSPSMIYRVRKQLGEDAQGTAGSGRGPGIRPYAVSPHLRLSGHSRSSTIDGTGRRAGTASNADSSYGSDQTSSRGSRPSPAGATHGMQ